MTAHNQAKLGEIAKVVLMPGDPMRAKWIAETFLENAILVNEVRGMLCYTGTYKGKKISIMGHGMGIPSIGIYSYELYKFYEVQTIIRIGSTGSYKKELNVNDVVLVQKSYSDSTFASLIGAKVCDDKVLLPTKEVNELIEQTAKDLNLKLSLATCHASDVFYNNDFESLDEIIDRTKSDCVDMESFGLFANAQILNKNAATLLTVSDSLITGDALSPTERANTFKKMVTLALESAIKLL
ncbi:purine-nucleoside phosphorylase [Ureaplasma urealyticum]|uniref:Uridine phosphorylase n=3 Tax=Ureaplasma urealyticum TaxID=2130 RepID=A0AAP9ABT8_UREUR|nr:purine-nucleoside phosphorylase [Ureaplasma urealyticum]EDX53976.1 purine nucleoside phosphorylase [Ureaplasma urealyticum serovar 9 str. ATCC 33175]ACI59969.1 purine nucleoside phosphorylase [Ureaplasma urealyticum serovar 10 str. ATCC 33699]EDT49855.1 purine nucleoside phosphorylase [Ureaplasma urealyticum serovar 13 str. ATCC 33698]EDU06107.1 purine nucleoside phosphorylase [Ureaplasma urealyticum serovar 5 str. ATCC 27817]EDU57044.1 purine nucleoside phosphorylase [Ureaplasma urealyticu